MTRRPPKPADIYGPQAKPVRFTAKDRQKHKLRWNTDCSGRAVCANCGMTVKHDMHGGPKGGGIVLYRLPGGEWEKEKPPCPGAKP